MKRIYLIIITLLAAGSVSAQSLQLSNVFISGDPSWFLEGHATVENISANPIDVKVERVEDNVFPGHVSYFCWVQCYAPFVSISPDHITIPPGGTEDVFRGDLETYGINGISNVSYCFYDANNTADSVCVKYSFSGTTGLEDIPSNLNFISKPFPNPASDFVSFFYNRANPSDRAVLRVFNVLGSQVKEVNLNETRSTIRINTTDLNSGMYFYSLYLNNKSVSSGKLMINRY